MVEIDGGALRNAEFASLTSRAVTDAARKLTDELFLRLVDVDAKLHPRKRQRGKTGAFNLRQGVEAFLGDLLRAEVNKERSGADGWVYRSVSPKSFTDGAVSSRNFAALRGALKSLELVEETPSVQQWWGPRLLREWATRFRATPKLVEIVADFGIPLADVGKHFIRGLPERPLVLKGASRREPRRSKVPGKIIKIKYTGGLRAMEQTIKELNSFMDRFIIGGGVHRGYIRVFNVGDHRSFSWNLGGRLYSQGEDSYQQMPGAERLNMTIDGEAVCELDIRASYLTIFQAQRGQPLDLSNDQYVLDDLGEKARDVVKTFIAVTFGSSQFPDRWPPEAVRDHEERTRKKAKGKGENLKVAYPSRRCGRPWRLPFRCLPSCVGMNWSRRSGLS